MNFFLVGLCLALLGSVASAVLVQAPCNLEGQHYDFVIVGSGPAVGPLARRLRDADHSVAILEQGPFFFGQETQPASKPNTDKNPEFGDLFQVYENVWEYTATAPKRKPTWDVEKDQQLRSRVKKSVVNELGLREDFFSRLDIQPTSPSGARSKEEARANFRSLQRRRAYPYAQVQGFGGQTLTYGGLHLRPSPGAFSTWPEEFSWEQMLPWYEKLEKSHFICSEIPEPGTPDPDLAHQCGSMEGFVPISVHNDSLYPPLVDLVPTFCQNGSRQGLWINTCKDGDAQDYNGDYPNRAFCGPPQFAGSVTQLDGVDAELTRATVQATYLTRDYIDSFSSSELLVCTQARVRRLIVDGEKIISAEVDGSHLERVQGNHFILAAGVRHTPEILMSSMIGDPALFSKFGLQPNLALSDVGKYFHDEWAYALTFNVTSNPDYFLNSKGFSVRNRDQMHLIKAKSRAYEDQNFTDIQLYLRLANALSLDLYLPTEFAGGFNAESNMFGIRVAMFQHDTFGNESGVWPTNFNGEFPDRFQFKVDMFQDENLLDRFLIGAWDGLELALKLVDQMLDTKDSEGQPLQLTPTAATRRLLEAASRSIEDFEYALSDESVVLALHGGGTCALGRCVDSDFRVKGMKNLYVCDMSILPTPVDANPSATVFALGERLAEELLTASSGSFVSCSAILLLLVLVAI